MKDSQSYADKASGWAICCWVFTDHLRIHYPIEALWICAAVLAVGIVWTTSELH